jgi:hypothetical protein
MGFPTPAELQDQEYTELIEMLKRNPSHCQYPKPLSPDLKKELYDAGWRFVLLGDNGEHGAMILGPERHEPPPK